LLPYPEAVFRGRPLLVAGLLLLSIPAAALSAGRPEGRAAGETTHLVSVPRGQVLDYWTPARMRSAQPLDPLIHRLPRLAAAPAPAVGERRVVRPARPAVAKATADGPTPLAGQVHDQTRYPARTHGKVFLTIPGQGDFECSGTAVRSPSHKLALSAGHCVYDDITRTWATNWIFVPAYDDGTAPFGRWPARKLATTDQWRSGDFRYDVGAATLARNRRDKRIQDVIGARGIVFNRERDKRYVAFGYPAAAPFDGEQPYRCDSRYQGDDQRSAPPRPMRIGCDMTGGASGGGWVIRDRYVASVTSYGYACLPLLCPEPDKLFGPYFGSTIERLYDSIR
jgi:V8-like Glu-specific endopeptidase